MNLNIRMKMIFFSTLLLSWLLSCKEGMPKDNGHDYSQDSTVLLEAINFQKDTIANDYLLGKFDPKSDDQFVIIPKKYTNKDSIYLRKEALDAFIQLYDSAKQDGITLTITSGTRNFDYQNRIWTRKWKQYKEKGYSDKKAVESILTYSAMPCISRHHWGTEIDINTLDNQYYAKGLGLKEYEWLKKNAINFGFCQTYTPKDSLRSTGYNEEKWHWSYLPISQKLTNAYKKQITYEDIKGFYGDSFADSLQVIDNYVMGINPDCL